MSSENLSNVNLNMTEDQLPNLITVILKNIGGHEERRRILLVDIQIAIATVAKTKGFGSLDIESFSVISMKKNRHTFCEEIHDLMNALIFLAPYGVRAHWTLSSGWDAWEILKP